MDDTSEDKSTLRRSERAHSRIQTLAPEILAEIFKQCLPIDHHQCLPYDGSQAPLLLGRVCRRWRTISISSPLLWSSFAIDDSDNQWSRIDCTKALGFTKLWISRSRSCPLSIILHYPRSSSHAPLLAFILASIVSQSWRWKDINITVSSEYDSLVHAPFQTGDLSHLENFQCTIRHTSNRRDVWSLDLSSAPKLQVFDYFRTARVQIDFGGRLHHAKKLDIKVPMGPGATGMTFGDLLTCLTHCPSLEEFRFCVNEPWTSDSEMPSIIELYHLRHFFLWVTDGVNSGFLFDALSLPALKHLELLMDLDPDHHSDWPHLRNTLARSRPPLQHLRLSCIPMKEKTLIECLSYTPLLTSISLGNIECSDTLLRLLTLDKDDPSSGICPRLGTLTFGGRTHFSSSAMIAMIRSRHQDVYNENGKLLKTLDCSFSGLESITSNPDIAKCVADGLKLVVGNTPRQH